MGKKRVFPDVDRVRGDNDDEIPEKRSRTDQRGEGDVLSDAPRELHVMKYVAAHVSEIELLNKEVQREFTGKTTIQKLPRHMQRRAMNHDIRRLPRSVRPAGKMHYENQTDKKRKTPSRFHRRRPKHLLQEYERRQRKNVWLETHIWHAKRFHMADKWAFKIPVRPTQKSERACYRAFSKHCLLQDLSYLCCIEICGSQDAILTGLRQVTRGPTFAAQSCISGTQEGRTMIYWHGRYPLCAIAPVTFTWKPLPLPSNNLPVTTATERSPSNNDLSVTTAKDHRQLWVWCHPSVFSMIWAEFAECLGLTEDDLEDIELKRKLRIPPDRFSASAANADRTLAMKSLSGSVLRFRLTGPESGAVLFDALPQAGIVPVDESGTSDAWWKRHYADSEPALAHVAQREITEEMRGQSPAELPPCCVVGLTARDPRLSRPWKKMEVVSERPDAASTVSVGRERITTEISSSPLWKADIRNEVTATKMSDHDMNTRREENLVPGTALHLGDEESRVPVMLIQQPASHTTPDPSDSGCRGRGAGWDILVPRGWGMPTWISLVYRGARTGGLQENAAIGFETRTLVFPDEFPDTVAGKCEMDKQEKEEVEKYNRRPIPKRINYTVLGVVSPFSSPWQQLVEEWNESEKDVAMVTGASEPGDIDDCKGTTAVTIENEMSPENDGVSEKSDQMPENGFDRCRGATAVEIEVDITPENASVTEKSDFKPEKNDKCQETTCTSTMEIDEISETVVETTVSDISSNSFYVLRDTKVLKLLQSFAKPTMGKKQTVLANRLGLTKEELLIRHSRAIVAVTIDMMQKGSAGQFSMICLPTKEDLSRLKREENYGGPLEPHHPDPAEVEKRKLKKERKEKKIKKKVKVDRRLTVLADQEKVTVRNCSRDVIGYLTSGGHSLASGNGMGKGFVTAPGLMALFKGLEGSPTGAEGKSKGVVLVRSTMSPQYRFAKLTVLN